MHTKALLIALMTAMLLASASAAGNVPGIGSPAPDFSLSAGEETFRLADLEGDQGVVLVFFRGLW